MGRGFWVEVGPLSMGTARGEAVLRSSGGSKGESARGHGGMEGPTRMANRGTEWEMAQTAESRRSILPRERTRG